MRSKQKLLYLIWLLPASLLFLIGHQGMVYYSLVDTYSNGSSYTAEVVEFELKQIAAQTNGYIVLSFTTESGDDIQQKLSLPVEMAGELQKIRVVPVRYRQDAFQNIVMMPTYETHKGLILTNIGMAFIGFLISLFAAVAVHRYLRRNPTGGNSELIIERIDK